jgi:DeoR family transcriptional regulator, fructose operon transcriptional repressor
MIPFVRRQQILSILDEQEIVYIADLLDRLEDVSESTVRRDLKFLADDGIVRLLHGGAATRTTEDSSSYDMPVEAKRFLNTDQKRRIAAAAAALINDGEVVYIDSGTTTFGMIEFIKEKRIKVVTSNTSVLTELKDAAFQCIILGGEVTETLGSVTGPITDNLLRDMYFDKAFLGATGYSEVSGLSTPDFREANKKQIVAANSEEVYVLVDSSKAGRRSLCKFLDFSEATIITDEETEILRLNGTYRVAPTV